MGAAVGGQPACPSAAAAPSADPGRIPAVPAAGSDPLISRPPSGDQLAATQPVLADQQPPIAGTPPTQALPAQFFADQQPPMTGDGYGYGGAGGASYGGDSP